MPNTTITPLVGSLVTARFTPIVKLAPASPNLTPAVTALGLSVAPPQQFLSIGSRLQVQTTPPLPGITAVGQINVALAALAGSTKAIVASAATVDLGASTSLYVEISGNVSISSFGNNTFLLQDQFKILNFTGTPTIVFGASTIITATGQNILVQPGDTAIVTWVGPGATWKILAYWPAQPTVGLFSPTGRLTLTTTTPILSSSVLAAATIFYTPYPGLPGATAPAVGLWVPSYNGTVTQMINLGGEHSITLDSNSGHAGFHSLGGLFDVFWDDVNQRLCTSAAWASTTARTIALEYKNGFLTNAAGMATKFDTSATRFTVPRNRGLYLGTFVATANGQTGMDISPIPVVGGNNTILGLYNAYNKTPTLGICEDATTTWTYASATWRAANGSSLNAISWVDGLGDVMVDAEYSVLAGSVVSTQVLVGINQNTAVGNPAHTAGTTTTANRFNQLDSRTMFNPLLGYNSIVAMESDAGGTNAATFFGSGFTGGTQNMRLMAELNI